MNNGSKDKNLKRINKMSFKKMDYIENNHESRITRLEVTIENINQTLTRIDKRLDSIDEKIESRFNKLDNRMWMMVFWMTGSFAGVFLMLAKIKGWI